MAARDLMTMPVRGLELLDGKLLDGLRFCAIAYDVLDAIQAEPDGREELRLLTTARAKKLLEEVLPIAAFVQNRYGPGFRIAVRWRGGNQRCDAVLRCTGSTVERLALPSKQHLEVTTAVHPKEYLAREHLHREGVVFAPGGVSRDQRSKTTVSKPVVRSGGDIENELEDLIGSRIHAKAAVRYPAQTSLLVRCVVTTPVLDDEWDRVVRVLRESQCPRAFREVILVEPTSRRVTSLYVRRGRSGPSSKEPKPMSRPSGSLAAPRAEPKR
jgi:hypothetical protein